MSAGELGMRLRGRRCACGSPDLIAVKPGRAPEIVAGVRVTRGEPDRAWCVACWPALNGRHRVPITTFAEPEVSP